MKYSKLSLVFRTQNPTQYFIGSQLRGGLGHSLKKVTCINPSYKCEECFASQNCLYYEFYESKNVFHKFRFDFELGKNYYDFSFYLFEDACIKLPYIVSAFHMFLTKTGLGKDEEKISKFGMYINDIDCFVNGQIKLPKNFINIFEPDAHHSTAILNFVTPLRIKKENHISGSNDFGLSDIVNSIYQRQMKLLGRDFKKFPYPIDTKIISKNLEFKELTRYSNRQKTTMKFGGAIGEMKLDNVSKEVWNILKLGELIGVGKQTTFGLGKINIISGEVRE